MKFELCFIGLKFTYVVSDCITFPPQFPLVTRSTGSLGQTMSGHPLPTLLGFSVQSAVHHSCIPCCPQELLDGKIICYTCEPTKENARQWLTMFEDLTKSSLSMADSHLKKRAFVLHSVRKNDIPSPSKLTDKVF